MPNHCLFYMNVRVSFVTGKYDNGSGIDLIIQRYGVKDIIFLHVVITRSHGRQLGFEALDTSTDKCSLLKARLSYRALAKRISQKTAEASLETIWVLVPRVGAIKSTLNAALVP